MISPDPIIHKLRTKQHDLDLGLYNMVMIKSGSHLKICYLAFKFENLHQSEVLDD